MLWTSEQAASARIEGWELADVVENGGSVPRLRVFGVNGKTNANAASHVMNLARGGSLLHISALRAIAQSAVVQPTTKARKK